MRTATETSSPAYVSLMARPLRVGVLVPDIPDIPWETVCAGALASQVRLWGGTSNILLPLRGDPAQSELFWALVDLWDPDLYRTYTVTIRDLEELDPARYSAWRAEWDEHLSRLPAEAQADELQRGHAEPLSQVDLPNDLERLLLRRGSALHFEGSQISGDLVSGTGAPSYPATDVLQLRPLPDEVLDPVAVGGPPEQLLLAAELGVLSPDLRDQLDELGVARRRLTAPDRYTLFHWLYGAQPPAGRPPFALSEAGLVWFRPVPFERNRVTLVAGEGAWDFALAYALRRAGTLAFWVPAGFFADGERESALQLSVWLAEERGMPLVVTSATDEEAAADLAHRVPTRLSLHGLVAQTSSWREALPGRPNRLLVRDSVGQPEPLYLEGDATPALRTPIPREVEPTGVEHLRWMTEVDVRDWGGMRHPALGEILLTPTSTTEARTTAEGGAYACPHVAVRSDVPLEHQTVRPQLRPLPLLHQLRAVASKAGLPAREGLGWECDLSEKGQFAIATSDLYGGFKELCTALRDPDVQGLFRAYLDADQGAPGLPLADRRRYLTLDDFRNLGLHQPANQLVDDLEMKRVLSRGVVLKCPRCRHADWYRPRDMDPTFMCTRCAAGHRPDPASWLREPEPRWRYRLDEVVFQFLRHRGDLPALVVFERFGQSRRAVQVIPELLLSDPKGDKRELDFAVAEGGDLWLGEAFTGPRYKEGQKAEMERLRRLAEVAELVNARGVVLATAADALADLTRKRAETVFPGPWPKLELRERALMVPPPKKVLE